ncbi:MAG: hypothetical protein U0165_06850 [Polyangiaceae bacterium]
MTTLQAPVARLLASPDWLGGGWVPEQRAIAHVFLENLRAALDSLRPEAALRASFSAVRSAYPLVPQTQLATACRIAIVLLVRELYREAEHGAGNQVDESTALISLAKKLAAAQTLASSSDTPKGISRDAILARIRSQINKARNEISGPHVGTFVDTFLNQARQSLSILAVRSASPEIVLHNAASRADRAANDVSTEWSKLPKESRQACAERAVVELAGAIATGAATHDEGGLDDDVARAWASDVSSRALTALIAWPDEAIVPEQVAPSTPSPSSNELSSTDLLSVPSPSETTMETKASGVAPTKTTQIINTLQNDALDAAWRTAGSQLVKLARDPLVGLISRHLAPGDESIRMKIALFLQTEVGTALLASVLSLGLSAMPNNAGPAPARLARELRVKAMADVGDLIAEVLMGPLRQVMSLYLQDMGGMVASVTPSLPDSAASELGASSSGIGSTSRVESAVAGHA